MKDKKNTNLIMEGNMLYEIDEECMRRGLNKNRRETEAKEEQKRNGQNYRRNIR